ncbi:MAG TPA: TadE family protein [Terriglobales bacterium]|nr:TadE family protein [Terriglobales bacterium]
MTHRSQRFQSFRKLLCRLFGDRAGQALAEAGIVLSFMGLLSIGIVEFGHAFMVYNVITHALRDGGRQAAVVSWTQRDANGFITQKDPIKNRVKDIMRQVVDSNTANSVAINVTQPTENGVNLVRVSIDATIPYIFGLVSDSFRIQRSMSFRDEGR